MADCVANVIFLTLVVIVTLSRALGVPIRVCNAYANREGLDVLQCHSFPCSSTRFRTKPARLLQDGDLLGYKQCEDLEPSGPLAGTVLDFTVAGGSIGSFVVEDPVPRNGSLYMVVVYRHDRMTTAGEFISHVFTSSDEAEIAVVDTYKGVQEPRIRRRQGPADEERHLSPSGPSSSGIELWNDAGAGANSSAWQAVESGVSLALRPGSSLDWRLANDHQRSLLSSQAPTILKLAVAPGEKYVAMRIGMDPLEGPAFPEELVIFPQEAATEVQSSAKRSSWIALLIMLVLADMVMASLFA